MHIHKPTDQEVVYRLRKPRARKFMAKPYVYTSRYDAIYVANYLLNKEHSYTLPFIEVYQQVTAEYYEPVNTLVAKIRNI